MPEAYITYVGWNALPYEQGQFRLDRELLNRKVSEINAVRQEQNDSMTTSIILDPVQPDYVIERMYPRNIYSLIPGVNIFCGLSSICTALMSPDEDLLVVKEQIPACRILLLTVGILEITWVGAVAIHGLASMYFVMDQLFEHSVYFFNTYS